MAETLAEAAYGLYIDYLGMKLHFAGDLAWNPTGTETLFPPEKLMSRSDWKSFVLVIERVGRDRLDNRSLLLTMFLANPKSYILDIDDEKNKERNKERILRLRSLETIFFDDMNRIAGLAEDSSIEFLDYVTTGSPPPIIKHFRSGRFHEETGAILDHITGFAGIPTNDPLWERRRKVLPSYLVFCQNFIDVQAAKESVCSTLINSIPT